MSEGGRGESIDDDDDRIMLCMGKGEGRGRKGRRIGEGPLGEREDAWGGESEERPSSKRRGEAEPT